MDHPNLNSNMNSNANTPKPSSVMITEATMLKWEEKLRKDPKVAGIHLLTDEDLILWHKYNFKESYLTILKSDVQRTRVKDRAGFDNYNDTLEMLLMFYCEMHIISYQQGMNEIMGPFLLFHHMFNIPLYRIYNLFSCFTQMFLTNYYENRELSALRSSIQLINLLLKYHEPELYLLFQKSSIIPQMYATNWLLTTFANKNKIEVLLTLWDFLIEESDELMMHYILIAFLRYHKKDFKSAEEAHIPELFSKTFITNCNELISIINSAKKIKQSTPLSFSILVNQIEIFKPNSTMHQELYDKYSIESMPSLPLFPSEVLYVNFKNILPCPDYKCRNFKNQYMSSEADRYDNKKPLCFYCRDSNAYSALNYCFIDLRIFKAKENYKTDGILPMTKIINHSNIVNEGFIEELVKELEPMKSNNTHFVLISTDALTYSTGDNNDSEGETADQSFSYTPNGKQNKEDQLIEGIEDGDSNGNSFEVNQNQIKEIKAIKQMMKLLLKAKFPYVSYVYGGFLAIHELSCKLSIPLSFHQPIKCSYCLMNKELQEFNREEVILFLKKTTTIDYYASNKLTLNARIEVQKDKAISMETFKELSQNETIKVYHCVLIRKNLCIYNKDKEEKTIIIFDPFKIMLLKLQINTEGKLELQLIELIHFKKILKLKRKKTEVTIVYSSITDDVNKSQMEKMIKVCLFTNGDSVNFSNEINAQLQKK